MILFKRKGAFKFYIRLDRDSIFNIENVMQFKIKLYFLLILQEIISFFFLGRRFIF